MAENSVTTFQGIPVASEGVNPTAFFALTRRKREPEAARAYAGLGLVDNVTIRKSDILSGIRVRFTGSIVVTPGTGTVATTAAFPYGLLKNVKLTANGQSNLIDCSGIHLKFREFAANPELTDRGVSRSVSGTTVTQGTLSKNSENWGLGQLATAIGAGTYPIEIDFVVPVAEDDRDLSGAVFCQTSSMDITLQLQWANLTDLFALTGNGTAAITGNIVVETEKFSIPVVNGIMVVPDLSLFHSIVQTNYTAVSTGENQVRLIGQGSGKQLLRLWFRTLNGAGQTALAVNATNYGLQSWVYGTNERPESYNDGQSLRESNEFTYGQDVAAVWGIACHEFASRNAFRDTVDMGQTSELRLSTYIQNGVVLTTPVLEYVQETVFAAGA
jgi:hypothetical protein